MVPCSLLSQREGAPRDVLLLDIALDSYFRLCVERTDLGSLRWVVSPLPR